MINFKIDFFLENYFKKCVVQLNLRKNQVGVDRKKMRDVTNATNFIYKQKHT